MVWYWWLGCFGEVRVLVCCVVVLLIGVYCLIVWFGLLVFVLRCLHVAVAKVGVVWCDIVCLSL